MNGDIQIYLLRLSMLKVGGFCTPDYSKPFARLENGLKGLKKIDNEYVRLINDRKHKMVQINYSCINCCHLIT